jgi:hypothetical protein
MCVESLFIKGLWDTIVGKNVLRVDGDLSGFGLIGRKKTPRHGAFAPEQGSYGTVLIDGNPVWVARVASNCCRGNLVQHARSSVAGVPNDTISSHWTVVCVGGAGIIQCGVVDLWKVEEGLDRREDCERIVAAARAGGRDHVGCVILGRGEDERRVWQWLGIAAAVPGFIGFAVGRTVFWDPLIAWRSKKATREETVAEIETLSRICRSV